MAESEYEDELEYEDDWGTIASEEERADDDLVSPSSEIEESFSLFNCRGTRGRASGSKRLLDFI